MLDVYDHVQSTRFAPESPTTRVVTSADEMHLRPGGCLNVARCVEALGEQVMVITCSGDDSTAEALKQRSDDMNVLWFGGYGATTSKSRVMLGHEMLLRYDVDREPEYQMTLDAIADTTIKTMEAGGVQCLVLSDYGKGVLAQPEKMIQKACQLNIPVVVDPKGDDWEKYRGATIIKPNMHELPPANKTGYLSESVYTVITRGSDGMEVIGPIGVVFINGIHRNAIDPTGAGDQVIAALAVFHGVKGCFVLHAARIANVIAGKSTEYEGVRPITMEECREECRKHHVAVPV